MKLSAMNGCFGCQWNEERDRAGDTYAFVCHPPNEEVGEVVGKDGVEKCCWRLH
jgi:hypothetical protein